MSGWQPIETAPTVGWFDVWRDGVRFPDTRRKGRHFAAELAWTSRNRALKQFSYRKTNAEMEHPTQKPLELMSWCLSLLPFSAGVVLDPFMGSGTTGAACAGWELGFIGIEREPTYFDIACRRVAEAYRQPRLFADVPAKPVQPSLLGDAA